MITVRGLWNELTPVCMRCGKELITPQPGKALVYYCPNKYDGCHNQITTEEYYKIVEKLCEIVGNNEIDSTKKVNLTGYKFSVRSLDCVIEEEKEGHITFSVLNKKRL